MTLNPLRGPRLSARSPRALLRMIPRWIGTGAGALVVGGVFAPTISSGDVCRRSLQVRNAIVAASGGVSCARFSQRDLREITALDLSSQGITRLRARDFAGLARLESLDLSGNLLTSLPAGIFDDLHLLRSLHLHGNELSRLPGNVFDRLFLLEELTLHDNQFTSLPENLFDEFSRFDGIGTNGGPPDNSGNHPRIQRFLDRHRVTSPAEFIAALPALYKERFVLMYGSEAAAAAHVSADHPRVISWGADGHFIFAWNTDPDAPSEFRESVEFLRQDDTAWTAGIVDFSGAAPVIHEPATCASCHGSLNKPLWGQWATWAGSEFRSSSATDYEVYAARLEALMESTDPRIEPLDFSASSFPGSRSARFLVTPGELEYVTAVEEAGAAWSWRHAEVLFRILQARHPDFIEWGTKLVCHRSDVDVLFQPTVRSFRQSEHNLFVAANSDLVIEDGLVNASDLVRYNYYYHPDGSIGDALIFLTIVELWKADPVVRHLYRNTPNQETTQGHAEVVEARLHYPSGSATAEDELIQKLRLHFGQGGRTALKTRARQHDGRLLGVLSASFWDGHAELMRRNICRALRESAPEELRVGQEAGNPVLSWDAPGYDTDSVTGYRVLRGVDGGTPTVVVEDTSSTATTWTDDDAPGGDLVYVVVALYDGYYLSRSSNEVETTVVAAATAGPVVTGSLAFAVLEGDTAVATLTATDADTPAADLVWSLAGGADRSRFALTPNGVLAFAAARDFEAPDDADGDGTYQLTVTVSDGDNRSSADLRVTLTNRNEPPAADAGEDQDDVEEGTTVTLRGRSEDPDAGDASTYAWTQAGGPVVTLATPSEATTTFLSPTGLNQKTTFRFTLRVTDSGGLYAEDSVAVTVTPSVEPLTARVEGLPETHDGTVRSFRFRLYFSEEIRISYRTLRDSSFVVQGGTIRRAKRLAPPSNVGWRITVRPDSDAAVALLLPANIPCDDAGAVCTRSGKRLSRRLESRSRDRSSLADPAAAPQSSPTSR